MINTGEVWEILYKKKGLNEENFSINNWEEERKGQNQEPKSLI